jgi:ketosteroid isomerase-like protein
MSDDRLKLLQEGIDAFNRGEAAPALFLFADDLDCFIDSDLMNAGTYKGHDGYLKMLEAWGEAWQTVKADIVAAEAVDNDHLLVEINQSAVGAGSGVPVQMTIYWLFRFVDGKITRFHLYADHTAALEAARN